MRKLIGLLGLLTASVFHSALAGPEFLAQPNDGYCIKLSLVNFPENAPASLKIKGDFDEYLGHDLHVQGNPFSIDVPSSGFFCETFTLFPPPANGWDWLESSRIRKNVQLPGVSIRNMSLFITTKNDVAVKNCMIDYKSITKDSSSDKMTITRVDDQHYTCEVSQG